MARVPYVSYDDAPPQVRELYDSQLSLYGGRLANFHLLFGHLPWVYRWYIGFQKSRHHGPLPEELRVMIQIQTSLINACSYCTKHNSQIAEHDGIPAEKLAALDQEKLDPDLFTEREIAALNWTRAVATKTARQDMAAFAEVEKHFTPTEIVDLTFQVAFRTLSNLMIEALWADFEEDGLPQPQHPPRSALADYARGVLADQLEKDANAGKLPV